MIDLISGLKEHAAVDANMALYWPLPYHCTVYRCHTRRKIKPVYADKGCAKEPSRDFLALNKIEDGIMRKDSTTAKLTAFEIQHNKAISKIRYIVEQYFSISHLHDGAKRVRFITLIKNKLDAWFRQAAFNVARGLRI